MRSLVRDGDGVGGWVVWLRILGRHFQLLPTIEGNQGYALFWGSDGPPVVPDCWYEVPGEKWGWGGWVVGLTLDFRSMLPVDTHNRGCSGKMDHFGGMCCCLGGLMGPFMVPDCWYGVPGEGWGWGRWVSGRAGRCIAVVNYSRLHLGGKKWKKTWDSLISK